MRNRFSKAPTMADCCHVRYMKDINHVRYPELSHRAGELVYVTREYADFLIELEVAVRDEKVDEIERAYVGYIAELEAMHERDIEIRTGQRSIDDHEETARAEVFARVAKTFGVPLDDIYENDTDDGYETSLRTKGY